MRKDYGKILKANGLEARRWMKNTSSSTARVYDRNLEDLEITVDLYGEWARIVDYSSPGFEEEEEAEIIDLTSRFLYVEKNRIVFSRRRKREGREQHEKNEKECQVKVTENGLVFECELEKYADTGLFLDMTETRSLVREMSLNERVLNLFSYTGSFSVYAAAGGAESVTSVDLSNVYTAWARRNLDNNGFLDSGKYPVVTADSRTFLKNALEEKKVYDLVILDPPAFSNSHKADVFDVQKDHAEFLDMIYSLLSDGGVVIFSENLGGFKLDYDKLRPLYDIEEITSSVYALNFSHKRKSCRVWVMKKNSEKKRERKERKMSEKLERFDLDLDEKTTERKREKKEARAFAFDEEEKSSLGRDGYRKNDDGRKNRYTERRNDYRKSGDADYRKKGNSPRYSDRDVHSSGRDYSSRYSESGSRYSDKDNYSRYSERRDSGSRYSDRNNSSRYSDNGSRRTERDNTSRYRERREDGYRRRDDDFSRDGKSRYNSGEKSYSKRSGHSSFERRDSYGSRESYKRSSYHNDERRDTMRGKDGKKRSTPKPFGYDSFMENKNREGATTRWLEEQEYIEKKED